MGKIRVRDPGAALTAADEDHLPYQTKRRTRATRGPRSLLAALVEIKCVDGADGEPFPTDRFSDVTWTPVFGRKTANKATHPAEQLFRFSAFRYLVDEARKNTRASSRELAQVLLGDAEAVDLLNRYYYDCPGEELPSLHTCSEAVVAAFNSGWLPHLAADSLSDDGACAALRLVNLRKCEEPTGQGGTKVVAVGLGKSPGAVEACVDDARDRRLEIGRRARAALKSLVRVCPALEAVQGVPMHPAPGAEKQSCSAAMRARSASKSLQALELVLRSCSSEVRWSVDWPSGHFVQEIGRLALDLSHSADLAASQERILHLGRVLATVRTGISMAGLARRLGGGNFFEVIDVPQSDEDFDEENSEEEVICAVDPERYAKLLSAIDAWKLREFGGGSEKDVWMSRLPSEVMAEAGIPVD